MTSERKCREWDIMPDCSIVPGWVRSYRAGLGRARCAYPVHFRQHSAADWFPVRAEPSFGCCCWGHLDSWKEKKKNDEPVSTEIRHFHHECGRHVVGFALSEPVSIWTAARPRTSANHQEDQIQAVQQQQEFIYFFVSNK